MVPRQFSLPRLRLALFMFRPFTHTHGLLSLSTNSRFQELRKRQIEKIVGKFDAKSEQLGYSVKKFQTSGFRWPAFCVIPCLNGSYRNKLAMQVTRGGAGKIAPVEATRRAARRDSDSAQAEDVNPERPKSKALTVVRDQRAQAAPRAASMSVPLAAQMIAQKSTAKSDRRLARHFPERALAAYLAAAAGPSRPGPTATTSA